MFDPLRPLLDEHSRRRMAAAEAKAIGFGGLTRSSWTPVTVNAREILQRWDGVESENGVRAWLKGPLDTQVIVEDKTSGVPFDFGRHSALPSARIKDFTTVRPIARQIPLVAEIG